MWYWRVWQGATHVRCIDVEESTAAEKFRGPKVINTVITTNTAGLPAISVYLVLEEMLPPLSCVRQQWPLQ